VGEAGAIEETAAVVVLLDVPAGEVAEDPEVEAIVDEELELLQPEKIKATIKSNTTGKINFFNFFLL
jgi:hypothetical protein